MALMHLCLRPERCLSSFIPLLRPGFPQGSLSRADAAAQPPEQLLVLQLSPAHPASHPRGLRAASAFLGSGESSAPEALDAMELEDLLGYFCSRITAAFLPLLEAAGAGSSSENEMKFQLGVPRLGSSRALTLSHLGSPFHSAAAVPLPECSSGSRPLQLNLSQKG